MIKNVFKNFFKNLLYLFIPMGIIYFGLLIAIFTLLNSSVETLKVFINDAGEIANVTITTNQDAIINYFTGVLSDINWTNDIVSILKEILSNNFIAQTIDGLMDLILENTSANSTELNNLINQTAGDITRHLTIAITTLTLSILIATLCTNFMIRKKNLEKSLLRKILTFITEPIVTFIFILGATFLLSLWHFSIYITFTVGVIVYIALTLCNAWISSRDKKTKFKDVVNIKTGISLLLADLIILLLIGGILNTVYLLSNFFVVTILAIPLIIYALAIISVNAETYVQSLNK